MADDAFGVFACCHEDTHDAPIEECNKCVMCCGAEEWCCAYSQRWDLKAMVAEYDVIVELLLQARGFAPEALPPVMALRQRAPWLAEVRAKMGER
jgi:hypothetical protein